MLFYIPNVCYVSDMTLLIDGNNRLKPRREHLGISRKALSVCTGIPLRSIQYYEEEKEQRLSFEEIESNLMTGGIPNPDLIIRTSGEYRISNFLLWKIAYSELYFTPILWPDFSEEEIKVAFAEYSKMERRFGRRLNF